MSFFEKFKLSVLYDGLTKEEYISVIPYIITENNRRLRIYNFVGLFFVFTLFVISLIFHGFAVKTLVYLGGSFCNLAAIILLYSKAQKNIILSKFLNYFFNSLMLIFTIYIGTIKNSRLPATTFFAALAIIPYITYNKVIFSFIHRLIFLLLFFFLSAKTKCPEYVQTDLINGISVFILSTLAGVRVQKLQVKGWLINNAMDNELKQMSGVFESIRIINLALNTSVDYSTNRNSENRIIGSNNNASKQMDEFVDNFVSENNKARMRRFCDLSTIEDRMFTKKIRICDFAATENSWCRATFVSMEEDSKGFPTKVVFTIQRIADAFYLNMLDFDLKNIK